MIAGAYPLEPSLQIYRLLSLGKASTAEKRQTHRSGEVSLI